MRGIYFVCFILLLPVLAVVGHDIYHAYGMGKNGIDLNHPFEFSALGWLWTTYAKDSYVFAHENIDPDLWKKYIGPVLEQKAVLIALVPDAFIGVILLFMKIFGLGPFQGEAMRLIPNGKNKVGGKKPKGYAFKDKNAKVARAKYKRK